MLCSPIFRYSFNGVEFEVQFMDPLDMYGCTKHVADGVEPNGYGTCTSLCEPKQWGSFFCCVSC